MRNLALTDGNFIFISSKATSEKEIVSEMKKRFKTIKERRFVDSLSVIEVCGEKHRDKIGRMMKCALTPEHKGKHSNRP